MSLLQNLKENYKYSDYYQPDERYEKYLRKLRTEPLTRELIDYICSRIDNTESKRSCELKFIHLQPLFINPSVSDFDIKDYLRSHIMKCRRLWLKLFFIRAYAIHADEAELIPVMRKFEASLQKTHDYQDYEYILSEGGLPFLCNKYGYACFAQALMTAEKEYLQIDPLLRGFFTFDEAGDFVKLLTPQQIQGRLDAFLKKKGL